MIISRQDIVFVLNFKITTFVEVRVYHAIRASLLGCRAELVLLLYFILSLLLLLCYLRKNGGKLIIFHRDSLSVALSILPDNILL